MPVKFHCPNPACGRALTVSDDAAGRTGKCPGCGGKLVVPQPQAAVDEELYDLEPDPDPEPEPVRKSKPRPMPQAARQAVSTARAADPDWDAVNGKGPAGPVISFEVIGLGWELLKRQMGTWILAMLAVGVVQCVCQAGMMFVATLGAAAEIAVIGNPMPLSPMMVMLFGGMLQIVLYGGLYKLALKQVDGGEISVGDAFAFEAAPRLVVAGVLSGLGTILGFMCLVIPGLIFTALSMFTLPAVVDGLGGFEALKRSVGTLKRQWFMAVVYLLVMGMITTSGVLLLGFGLLITVPLFMLAVTVQYRRSFARGGVPRKVVVADPWAEAAGEPPAATGSGRVPAWAWGILGVGMVMPVLMVGMLVALLLPAIQAARQAAARAEMRQQMAAGFPVDAQDEAALREHFQPPPGVLGKPPGFDAAAAPAPASPVRTPKPKPAPARKKKDPFHLAFDLAKDGGDKRSVGLRQLASQRVDDGHRAEVAAMVEPLLRDPEVAPDAAQALGSWAGPDQVPMLIAGLDSEDPRVRTSLIRALGRLKADAGIPVLVQRLGNPVDRYEAATALQLIGPKASPELRKVLTSNDANVRRDAGHLLQQISQGDPDTRRTVAVASLKSPDQGERARGLRVLARLPATDNARGEVLATALPLLQDRDVSVRRAAIEVFERWGTEVEAPALLALLNDPDLEVRRMAIPVVTKTPNRQSAVEVARLLMTPDVRREAVNALKTMNVRDKEVEAEVRKALDNPDPAAREAACQVLEVIGTSASIPALRRALTDRQRNVANAARAAGTAITKGNTRKKR